MGLLIFYPSAVALVFALANALIEWWAFRDTKLTLKDRRWEREGHRGETARAGKVRDYEEGKQSAASLAAEGQKEEQSGSAL